MSVKLTSIPQGSVASSIMAFKSVAMFSLSDNNSDRVLVPRMFLRVVADNNLKQVNYMRRLKKY